VSDPVYGTPADLARLAPPNALAGVSADAQNDMLARVSRRADDSLQAIFVLPLVAWSASLTDHVCYSVLYNLLFAKGAASAETKLMYRDRFMDAENFFKRIEHGLRSNGIVDSSVDQADEPDQDTPVIAHAPTRGWGRDGF
jgi:phage gp36-like protein